MCFKYTQVHDCTGFPGETYKYIIQQARYNLTGLGSSSNIYLHHLGRTAGLLPAHRLGPAPRAVGHAGSRRITTRHLVAQIAGPGGFFLEGELVCVVVVRVRDGARAVLHRARVVAGHREAAEVLAAELAVRLADALGAALRVVADLALELDD